ncbi:MAG TPA: galactokinase [Acidobacteriaceae bacterium]|nr:galactokinase [Acidobacteriaceae bacterium]
MISVEPLLRQHAKRFGAAARAFQAPGRVNLIGEHTDYTGGLVMPAAIDFNTVAVVGPAASRSIISSVNLQKEFAFDASALPENQKHDWTDYPVGVLWSLGQSGVVAPQFAMTLQGDVPLGAGLSSSASIEVAVAFAALALAGKSMSLTEIALACKKAENGFVGAQSGIMDQYIACCGVKGHALVIDTRDLSSRAVPLPADARLVICNSMVKHSHAGGEYNERRAEVDEGSHALRAANPKIHELRDAALADLEQARGSMSENAFRRCRHIVTENARVEQAARALAAGDMRCMGQLMYEAHASYRDDFAASCPEADLLVELAAAQPGIIGARLTGGGFGGCTVNLVESAHAEAFRKGIHAAYLQRAGIDADIYLCQAAGGASELPV